MGPVWRGRQGTEAGPWRLALVLVGRSEAISSQHPLPTTIGHATGRAFDHILYSCGWPFLLQVVADKGERRWSRKVRLIGIQTIVAVQLPR
jgi:hypothetical protein